MWIVLDRIIVRAQARRLYVAVVDVPEEIATLLRPIIEFVETFSDLGRSGNAVDFSGGERDLMERIAALETGCLGRMLKALDPVAPRVEVGGRTYRRMNNPNTSGKYFAMRGGLSLERGLYREEGVRNGPTIVPMELRAGIVEGLLTPAAAQGIAAVGQGVPSREGDAMCSRLGVLPYSRSEHFRSAIDVGERWGEIRELYEDELVENMAIPTPTAAVSVAVDRVSLPIAEPRALTADDRKRGVQKPIAVALRMAFSAVITLYDGEGTPNCCIRYAHVPTGGAEVVEDALRHDLAIILRRRPDLTLVSLADGAPEMQSILDRATAGLAVTAALIDVWHLLEKLGEAATASGEDAKAIVPRFRSALLANDGAIDDIEVEVRTWALRYKPEEVPEKLHAAATYIKNNRERMRYATAHAAGLPIGSGTVEATGKTIVETRMRRSGSRWDERGAQPILHLRALSTSSGARWGEAIAHVVASYTAEVKQLPARIKAAGRRSH